MKYLKLFENVDINFDDWDEEERDNYDGVYYLTRRSGKNITLTKIILEEDHYNDTNYQYKYYDTGKQFWYITKPEVEEDLDLKTKYNSIYLFKESDWGSPEMKQIFHRLTGQELPEKYTKPISVPIT